MLFSVNCTDLPTPIYLYIYIYICVCVCVYIYIWKCVILNCTAINVQKKDKKTDNVCINVILRGVRIMFVAVEK